MKSLNVILVAIALVSLTGCGGCANTLKHTQSDWFGLNRKITLYNANGGVIKEWQTKAKIEDRGGSVYFLDKNGKATTISGTFVVEEL